MPKHKDSRKPLVKSLVSSAGSVLSPKAPTSQEIFSYKTRADLCATHGGNSPKVHLNTRPHGSSQVSTLDILPLSTGRL